jgi:hypothetical protein
MVKPTRVLDFGENLLLLILTPKGDFSRAGSINAIFVNEQPWPYLADKREERLLLTKMCGIRGDS